jgi:FkbM family methyltransferase
MLAPETRLRVFRALTKIPPLTSTRVRATILKSYKAGKWKRARVAERLGSARFSKPAMGEMDVQLAELLGDGGVFVEAGANDGFRQSNTYYLERFCGWTGVLVEPIPELATLARERREARVFNCALVASGYAADTVTVRYGDLMSGIGSDLTEASWGWEDAHDVVAPARTLTSLLDEAGIERIDLLSLDVEGYEASVLDGLDLGRFAPRFVLLEVLQSDLASLMALLPGYEVLRWLTERDALLTRQSRVGDVATEATRQGHF